MCLLTNEYFHTSFAIPEKTPNIYSVKVANLIFHTEYNNDILKKGSNFACDQAYKGAQLCPFAIPLASSATSAYL